MGRDETKLPRWLLACVAIAIATAGGLLLLYLFKFWGPLSDSQEIWGQFGDFLGGILNPLFSIVGLMALLYTIRLQSREMANSTLELSRSAEALNQQNYHNAQQAYDSRLFHLMSLHSQTLAQLTIREQMPHLVGIVRGDSSIKHTGGKAISYALKMLMLEQFFYVPEGEFIADHGEIRKKYNIWRGEYWSSLSRYFASVRNLIAFISSEAKYRPNKFAVELLRSQLDVDEQMLIIIVCCLEDDMNGSLPFLVKHNFGGRFVEGIDFSNEIERLVKARTSVT